MGRVLIWSFVLTVVVAVWVVGTTFGLVAATPSACDVSVTNQVLAPGSMLTYSCPSQTTPSATGYRVSSDQPYSVLFTDGADCTSATPNIYPQWSSRNVSASITTTRLVRGKYGADGAWASGPCFRVRNDGSVSTATLSIQINWFSIDYSNQFHLSNTGQYLIGVSGQDVNIASSWSDLNLTGNGVVIDIVDDGLQIAHAELAAGARLDLSYNYQTSTNNPTSSSATDKHGTGCGGIAAADGANSICGKGAAYRAQIAGHRILFSGAQNTHVADAMFNTAVVTDVSSNSWGPDGCTANGCLYAPLEPAIQSAIQSGALTGRIVPGSTTRVGRSYVFAAGNEAHYGGDANMYTYAKLKEVITIAGSGIDGKRVFYSNAGANLFVNAPTQGQPTGTGVSTDFVPGTITAAGGGAQTDCTDDFGGTSSATPLVAGIIALLLEARPSLGNREIQYILRSTATKNDPTSASWFQNAAGIWYSRHNGFGRINTGAAISAIRATTYTAPAAQAVVAGADVSISSGNSITGAADPAPTTNSTYTFAGGSGAVVYIEHVMVKVDASFPEPTGIHALAIRLYSPAGTSIDLTVPTRPLSTQPVTTSFTAYPLAARAFWGESAVGTWTISISAPGATGTGSFTKWQITVAGTAAPPSQLGGAVHASASASVTVLFGVAIATALAAARLH